MSASEKDQEISTSIDQDELQLVIAGFSPGATPEQEEALEYYGR